MCRRHLYNLRPFLRSLIVIGCAALGASPAAASDADRSADAAHAPATPVGPDLRGELLRIQSIEPEPLRTGEIVRLEVDETSRTQWRRMSTRASARLDVQLSSTESVSLELQRFEVVSSRTRLFSRQDGRDQPMAVPDVLLLRGSVADQPGSHAFLALTNRGGGSGSITLADGRRYELRTTRAGAAGPDRDRLILQRAHGGLPPFDEFCRLVHDGENCCPFGSVAGEGDPTPDPLFRGPRVLTIAIDTDNSYFQLFGNEEDALEYIVQLVAAVSDIFIRELDFHLVLGFARVWPQGGEPFSADNLGEFREWWLQNMDMRGSTSSTCSARGET